MFGHIPFGVFLLAQFVVCPLASPTTFFLSVYPLDLCLGFVVLYNLLSFYLSMSGLFEPRYSWYTSPLLGVLNYNRVIQALGLKTTKTFVVLSGLFYPIMSFIALCSWLTFFSTTGVRGSRFLPRKTLCLHEWGIKVIVTPKLKAWLLPIQKFNTTHRGGEVRKL